MEINITLGTKEGEYPFAMKSKDTDLVVMFTDYAEGVVIKSDGRYLIGAYSECWDVKSFEPFEGTINISN